MKRLIRRLQKWRPANREQPAPHADVAGHIDILDSNCVAGWACRADHSEVIVELFLNGVAIGTTLCNVDRPDVGGAGFNRRSGFYFSLSDILIASKNNRVYVRAIGSEKFLPGPSIIARDFIRENMKREGFDFSCALFVATAYSYELDGKFVDVSGEVKTSSVAPTVIRVISGGKLISVNYTKAASHSVLSAFGISVYAYAARFELYAEPSLQFEFEGPNQLDLQPICAIPGLGGLSSFAPTDFSRKRVVGTMTPNNYITMAFTSAALLWRLVDGAGKSGIWLDWGCGPGRTAIPLSRIFAKGWKICACDIDDFNVDVLRGLDANIQATVTELYPPLPYEDESFDVIHGISVLTHLTADNQKLWIEELARVLKPGGLALLTTHGELAVLISGFIDEGSPVYSAFTRAGISDEILDGALGPQFKDQNYYRGTFQTKANASALFDRSFEVVRYIPGGHHNHQDFWVLRRK